MFEDQGCGVKGDTTCRARVKDRTAIERTIIDALAADRRPPLRQMDTHLMRSSRFQTALDQHELAQRLDDTDVSDSPLSIRRAAAAAPAVAAIAHKVRLDSRLLRLSANDGEIPSFRRVGAHL